MKSAGCILLAVTNVSELCMWMESNNKVGETFKQISLDISMESV